jgi:hypothetical protein
MLFHQVWAPAQISYGVQMTITSSSDVDAVRAIAISIRSPSARTP